MPVLYDPFDRPIQPGALRQEHAPEDDDRLPLPRGQSVAWTLTPKRLAMLLRDAEEGDVVAYLTLAEEMEELDSHYRAVLFSRRMMVSSAPVVVAAASDEEAEREKKEALEDLVEADWFTDLVFEMSDGIAKGYAIVELLWDTTASDGRWRPRGVRWRDPRRYRVDPITRQGLRLEDGSPSGRELPPGKYVVHRPRLKSGLSVRSGLARAAAMAYVCKSFTVRDMQRFLEVYGIPARLGRYPKGASKTDKMELLRAARRIGSDAAAVIPTEMDIALLESKTSRGGAEAFIGTAQYWDAQISKLVLGQTMTSDNGSSKSQATVHNLVRIDIAQHDAKAISADLNRFLVRPFIDLNWGVPADGRYPRISLVIREKDNLSSLATVVSQLVDRGLEVGQRTIRDRVGLPEPEAGEALLEPITQQRPPEDAGDDPDVGENPEGGDA